MKLQVKILMTVFFCITNAYATDNSEFTKLSAIDYPRWVRLPVTVEATSASTVSAQTSGRIVELPFDVNDLVPQGAVIVKFSDSEQQAGLQQAKAALEEALSRQTEMEKEWLRAKEIREQGLISKSAFDQATANFDAAKARVAQATASVARANELLEQTSVKAPYSGIVQERFVELGELATPGKPLIRGLSLQHMRVSGQLPQQHVSSVQQADRAQIELADGQLLNFDNPKLTIAPEARDGGHSFLLRMVLPPDDYMKYSLYPGSWQVLKVQVAMEPVLILPKSAVFWRGEMSAVWQKTPEGIVLQYVRVQDIENNQVQVLSGLDVGTEVITDALAYLSGLSQ
ncbi:efflux RND transporter periplasmic adaptor subunit [Rheinheimera sp. KL1]|uniref:efflux RND transporter periplasmic adaptor subunit n=1 Tax=Rheinheimera sp. KL1 TaxID=1635005 RepID=UPI0006A97A08|nr:efflux RND transporter periplasmic adaptor subunit [Rheinheimera sp. KL1]